LKVPVANPGGTLLSLVPVALLYIHISLFYLCTCHRIETQVLTVICLNFLLCVAERYVAHLTTLASYSRPAGSVLNFFLTFSRPSNAKLYDFESYQPPVTMHCMHCLMYRKYGVLDMQIRLTASINMSKSAGIFTEISITNF